MKILITGANGQLAIALAQRLAPLGPIAALDRHALDLSRPESFKPVIIDIRPDLIVNAGAYTAVDKAEEEEALATTINADAVGELARLAKDIGARLFHYSTDYVFAGDKPLMEGGYAEDAATAPINAYGRSKRLGEEALAASGADYRILRTAWVYSTRGKNFFKTMLRLARERDHLTIVADQHGSPTLAESLAQVSTVMASRPEAGTPGIYHVTGSGVTSWHGFASALIARAHKVGLLAAGHCAAEDVTAIASSDFPTPARRPANSQLRMDKLSQHYGLAMPSWEADLEAVMMSIAETRSL